jgi:hypothetical protein
VIDAVLLGIRLNVPTLKDNWNTFRNRPSDGSYSWSREAYVEENYRKGDDSSKCTGKPITVDATLDEVIAKARAAGIHAGKRTTHLDDGESAGRSAFALAVSDDDHKAQGRFLSLLKSVCNQDR